MSDPIVRLATLRDLDRLVALEKACYTSDLFSEEQIEYLLTRAHATVLVVSADQALLGAAYMLWRKNQTMGRLYNIAVDPTTRGKGYGARLLAECEFEAAIRKCDTVSLEVRADNAPAIHLYKKNGYVQAGKLPAYYEDGGDGLRMLKSLPPAEHAGVRHRIPYYAQTLDFTCGPACLMMAIRHFIPDLKFERMLELTLWKEATLIFMTSGVGGTGPFGLAVSAQRRGFHTRVILSKDQTPFFASVRLEKKREVIRLVHEALREQAEDLGIAIAYYNFPFDEIAAAMYRGMIPIVLISTYRLSGDRAPHWVLVTGFDNEHVYVNDPDLESYDDDRKRATNVVISRKEFRRMRRYGKDLFKSVILIGPQTEPLRTAIDGSDL
jgi:ribosomal protein S18 acetylase RimI-like enzyme